jgi:hypothetical protein
MNSSSTAELIKKAIIALVISGGAAWVLWYAASLVK